MTVPWFDLYLETFNPKDKSLPVDRDIQKLCEEIVKLRTILRHQKFRADTYQAGEQAMKDSFPRLEKVAKEQGLLEGRKNTFEDILSYIEKRRKLESNPPVVEILSELVDSLAKYELPR